MGRLCWLWLITICASHLVGPVPTTATDLSFVSTNKILWQRSVNNAYTATGAEDTFAWTNRVYEGDIEFNVTITSDYEKGEGVVLYGTGSPWPRGCLIFNIANDFQAIRAHSIYKGGEWLASSKAKINFQGHSYKMTVKITEDRASLSVDGRELLTTFLPPDVLRRGRIGLFKHNGRPEVTFSNMSLKVTSRSDLAARVEKPPVSLGSRIALVIGNSAYKDAQLRNPVRDAEDLTAVLKMLGFVVTTKTDAGQRDMEEVIQQFLQNIKNSDVALFYFSGHGAQVRGENYLIPVGENILSENEIRYKAVSAGYVLGGMEESGSKTNIVILDACRNNPFKGLKSLRRGLGLVEAPAGSFIAYATAPGSAAIDGPDRNSVYTKHLLQALVVKGSPVEQAFKQVLRGVEQETQGKQIPWTSSSLKTEFYFRPQ